jgi:hypothetical protein
MHTLNYQKSQKNSNKFLQNCNYFSTKFSIQCVKTQLYFLFVRNVRKKKSAVWSWSQLSFCLNLISIIQMQL